MKLKYYKMNKGVAPPKFATDGSACFDICANIKEDVSIIVYRMSNLKVKVNPEWYDKEHNPTVRFRIAPADRVLIPTGLIFDIPEGYSVRLHTRSSVSLKKGLIMPNGEGIIDSDYYHQTFVMLYNYSADEVLIENGERIAQGELIKTHVYDIEETENIPEQKTNRVGGFGSTGIK
jgi:dUTP pyrophosphatase